MANKARNKARPAPKRNQRRVSAQQWIFVVISIIIVLTMVAMLMSSF